MIPKVYVAGLGTALPERVVSTLETEKKIKELSEGIFLPEGSVQILTGVKVRRVADENINASDLATEAALKAIADASISKEDIDCLIFAAASTDILEPATANIIQSNLGLECPVFDVKNACNSFVNAMDIADSLISSGKYKTVLIANGEVPSKAVRFSVNGREQLRRAFAGYTLGDAGAAMVLKESSGERGIVYSKFASYGEHWQKSAVLGGGTRYPRDPDKSYFEGETAGLKDIFIEIGPAQIYEVLEKAGWTLDDVDKIVVHQVSLKSFDLLVKTAKLPKEKLVIVLPYLGNMVSASIPVTLDQARIKSELKHGDKVLVLGLAAGVSIGTIALVW